MVSFCDDIDPWDLTPNIYFPTEMNWNTVAFVSKKIVVAAKLNETRKQSICIITFWKLNLSFKIYKFFNFSS